MTLPKIIQITPYYPPHHSGVGDHAWLLNEDWKRKGYSTEILVYHQHSEHHQPSYSEIQCFGKGKEASRCLLSHLESIEGPHCVILHYVGYGYAKRGAPYWLLKTMRAWSKRKDPSCTLQVMFHELYASGSIFSSAFWLSHLQKKCTQGIFQCSDRAVTSTIRFGKELKSWNGEKPVEVCGVFSNIAEHPILSQKDPSLAVLFGSKSVRQKVMARLAHFEKEMGELGIKRIIDIGDPLDVPIGFGIEVIHQGYLIAAEVSSVLSEAKYALLDYPVDLLGKSGVFASYLSHGCLSINFYEEKFELLNDSSEECLCQYESRSVEVSSKVFLNGAF